MSLYNFHACAMIAINVINGCSIDTMKLNKSLGNNINQPHIKAQSPYNNLTPLQIACQKENMEVVEFLLFWPEIDINAHQKNTEPVLHSMIKKMSNTTQRDITRLLVHHSKTNLSLADSDGKTPLHIAAQWNNKEVVDDIIDIYAQINPNLQDNAGNTPLHVACDCNHIEIVTKLLNHPTLGVDVKNNTGNTPLCCACIRGNVSIVSLLINARATRVKNGLDRLAIVLACQNNHDQCVDMLLKVYPQLIDSFLCENKDYLLHIAADNKSANVMKVLVNYLHNKIYRMNKENQTALHISCERNDKMCVRTLLEADITGINCRRNFFNQTALHIAAQQAKTSIIELLIQKGADPTMLDEDQNTALAYCYFANKINMLDSAIVQQMITAMDSDENTQLHLYAKNNPHPPRIIDKYLYFLLEKGLSVWSRNKSSQTGVDIAVQDYTSTYQFYLSKSIPTMKIVLDNQERVMHTFLRITSEKINAFFFKEFFKKFKIPADIQSYIMHYYYKVNIETIIARQYKDDRKYYDQPIAQKNCIKQQLSETLQNPHFLWKDTK